MGTSPLFYLAVVAYHAPAYPAMIGSVAMFWGYFRSWLKRLPRYDDPEFRRFLRAYQYACLRMGKRAGQRGSTPSGRQLWRASSRRSRE